MINAAYVAHVLTVCFHIIVCNWLILIQAHKKACILLF